MLVFLGVVAIGGETDAEGALADGGADALDRLWVVEVGSGGEGDLVALSAGEHCGCTGRGECPFNPIPETFGKVESAAGGIKEAFPPLGGELHESDRSNEERKAEPKEPKGGVVDKGFAGAAGGAGREGGMEGGARCVVHEGEHNAAG